MDRGKNEIQRWCKIATSRIRYGPDRKKVFQELYDHLEDHRSSLMEQGLRPEEASGQALAAMGSAVELAPQLAKIHRPFWGYALRISQILLLLLLCLSILPIVNYVRDLSLDTSVSYRDFEVFNAASYGSDTGRRLLHLSQPELTFRDSNSRFTITDACVFSQDSEYYGPNFTQLYIRIRQHSLLPGTEQEQYFDNFMITGWFSARDSLGNEYTYFMDPQREGTKTLNTTSGQTGIFTYTHECWINQFPAEAEWVEICYRRDGRNYALRIDLTGGGRK